MELTVVLEQHSQHTQPQDNLWCFIPGLRNKYSNLAANRRARLSRTSAGASNDKPDSPKSDAEEEDDEPIGDQLASVFGEPEEPMEENGDAADPEATAAEGRSSPADPGGGG